MQACAAALATGEAQRLPHRMYAADGSLFWFGTAVRVVTSTNGESEMVGVMTDLRDRMRAQQAAKMRVAPKASFSRR